MKAQNRLPLLISLTLSAAALLTACGDSAAKEEALRKEREALGDVDAARSGSGAPSDSGSDAGSRRTSLEFEAQPGWIEETPSSQMRVKQFRLPPAEGDTESPTVVVFLLGGSVQDNLKRWAGQFEGDPSAALATVEVKEVDNMRMHTIDITGKMLTDSMGNAVGKDDQRMLSTVIEATDGAFPGGQSYFVRLHGPVKTITKWEASYRDLLDSL